MFNKNFYPTPNVISRLHLLSGLELREKTILEPSAGKGDILDAIVEEQTFIGSSRVDYFQSFLYCMEIEPELQAILADKGYNLVGFDFLKDPVKIRFDYIIMNPPFDYGARHLLRAWEIMYSGTIRCLLNATTYDNPHTEERKLLKSIIEAHGEVTRLGQIFKKSERPTNVEVIMVELVKVSDEKLNLETDLKEARYHRVADDVGKDENRLVTSNDLLAREAIYNDRIEAYKEFVQAQMKYDRRVIPEKYKTKINNNTYNKQLNEHIIELTRNGWDRLIRDSKYSEFLTYRLRKEFIEKQFPTQRNIAFTYENMIKLLGLIMDGRNREMVLNNCILDCFDVLTRYHEDNRVHIEGWKTNDAYKVNKKIVLPRIIKPYHYSNYLGGRYELYSEFSGTSHAIDDLDIVMCYLSGVRRYDYSTDSQKDNIVTIRKALEDAVKAANNAVQAGESEIKTCESEFFKIKFYKKGTIHLEFKDKQLWQFFNCKASELRGYPLPEASKVYRRQQKPLKLL